jgi:hypothetical protein
MNGNPLLVSVLAQISDFETSKCQRNDAVDKWGIYRNEEFGKVIRVELLIGS